MRGRSLFFDLYGNLVCVVLSKVFSLHNTIYILVPFPVYQGQPPDETQDGVALYRYAKVIRIFSWRNSGERRSILVGWIWFDAIWKGENEIYRLAISALVLTILKCDFG